MKLNTSNKKADLTSDYVFQTHGLEFLLYISEENYISSSDH